MKYPVNDQVCGPALSKPVPPCELSKRDTGLRSQTAEMHLFSESEIFSITGSRHQLFGPVWVELSIFHDLPFAAPGPCSGLLRTQLVSASHAQRNERTQIHLSVVVRLCVAFHKSW